MGLLSGDINSYTVGKDLVTTGQVTAYDGINGNQLDTIPAGTDLGVCNNATDNTIFMFGNWWLSFPAPASPIGSNGAVTGPFYIIYNASALNYQGGTPINDNSGLNGLPAPIQNALTGTGSFIDNLLLAGMVISIALLVVFLVLEFKKK